MFTDRLVNTFHIQRNWKERRTKKKSHKNEEKHERKIWVERYKLLYVYPKEKIFKNTLWRGCETNTHTHTDTNQTNTIPSHLFQCVSNVESTMDQDGWWWQSWCVEWILSCDPHQHSIRAQQRWCDDLTTMNRLYITTTRRKSNKKCRVFFIVFHPYESILGKIWFHVIYTRVCLCLCVCPVNFSLVRHWFARQTRLRHVCYHSYRYFSLSVHTGTTHTHVYCLPFFLLFDFPHVPIQTKENMFVCVLFYYHLIFLIFLHFFRSNSSLYTDTCRVCVCRQTHTQSTIMAADYYFFMKSFSFYFVFTIPTSIHPSSCLVKSIHVRCHIQKRYTNTHTNEQQSEKWH